MPNLKIRLGRIELPNPVLAASGTFGGIFGEVYDLNVLGGIVLKTVTAQPRSGNPTPRVHETASGMLNSIGLENKGIDEFLKIELPQYLRLKCPVFVNIAGKTAAEFGELAARFDGVDGIAGIELNLSCPNVSGGLDFATDPKKTYETVSLARKSSRHFLISKLTPNVTDVVQIAKAAVDAGTDAISLINTVRAIAIDWRKRDPVLGAVTGGLSGPAIKPVAVRMVWEVASSFPKIPVIGIGGIMTADDVLEFMCAGASAVQIGTGNFVNPKTAPEVITALPKVLSENKIDDISTLIGSIKTKFAPSTPKN